MRQAIATGRGEPCNYDVDRTVRKLRRFLGPEKASRDTGRLDPQRMNDQTRFVPLHAGRLGAENLSCRPSPTGPR